MSIHRVRQVRQVEIVITEQYLSDARLEAKEHFIEVPAHASPVMSSEKRLGATILIVGLSTTGAVAALAAAAVVALACGVPVESLLAVLRPFQAPMASLIVGLFGGGMSFFVLRKLGSTK